MSHTCSECGDKFDTLTRLRVHDCDESSEVFSVRVRARLITNESSRYAQVNQPGLNEDQPVFPDFDLAVEPGESVPPQSVQQEVSQALDDLFREEHDLWGWAETVEPDDVRTTLPEGQEVTEFYPVGSIEVSRDGDIKDTFITLDELKNAVPIDS